MGGVLHKHYTKNSVNTTFHKSIQTNWIDKNAMACGAMSTILFNSYTGNEDRGQGSPCIGFSGLVWRFGTFNGFF